MQAAPSQTAGEIVLGPYAVAAEPARIAAFAAATGARGGGAPAAFPVVWLSEPTLKAALREAAGPERLPVHESQSFDYARPLVAGASYILSARARRETTPERLIVEAQVAEADGTPALVMRATLRLAPLSGGRAQ